MVDEKTTGFALRMRPAYKDAAVALTKSYFNEWKDDRTAGSFGGGSINEVLNGFIRAGIARALEAIETDLAEAQLEYNAFHEMMTFLLSHPAASHVRPENLPEGSGGREWIESATEEYVKLINYGSEARNPADRGTVAQEYANAQRRLHALIASKGAMQRALMDQR